MAGVSIAGVGWDNAWEQDKTRSHGKSLKTRRVPTCPLHAVLARF
jgi:hypothetical protein